MEKSNTVIELINICKSYKKNIQVLQNVGVKFQSGKFYVINGHSGSGKSTLINILGLIDFPSSGTYKLFNKETEDLKDSELSKLRMGSIGFVFQDFQLNETLNALENVMLPMTINKKIKRTDRIKIAENNLKLVGLEYRMKHFPKEMSGGEQQRVAIARALSNDPKIILADEPTGNLDAKTEKEIFEILKKLAINGKCVIVVSHSNNSKNYADITFTLENCTLKRMK